MKFSLVQLFIYENHDIGYVPSGLAPVVAKDVVATLKSGKLSAYTVDAWPSDPLAEDGLILKAPSVIMSPHLGANSRENLTRVGAKIVHIVDEFCKSGEKCAQNMLY